VAAGCLKKLGASESTGCVSGGAPVNETNPPAPARLESRNPVPVKGLDLLKKFKEEQGMK
jgi:hypothetical protein